MPTVPARTKLQIFISNELLFLSFVRNLVAQNGAQLHWLKEKTWKLISHSEAKNKAMILQRGKK